MPGCAEMNCTGTVPDLFRKLSSLHQQVGQSGDGWCKQMVLVVCHRIHFVQDFQECRLSRVSHPVGSRKLCKTVQDNIWDVDSCMPKVPCITWDMDHLVGRGTLEGREAMGDGLKLPLL